MCIYVLLSVTAERYLSSASRFQSTFTRALRYCKESELLSNCWMYSYKVANVLKFHSKLHSNPKTLRNLASVGRHDVKTNNQVIIRLVDNNLAIALIEVSILGNCPFQRSKI
mmetsp:Transcript_1276/g.1510  ORF Transcript_1276/g.1510 Transcript_1276/m.1510 type:complete len:112 (-) Transcript_1276:262-597(-)